MEKQLAKKIVLITGATHGLGKAISEKVAAMGATVVLVARDERKLSEVKASVEAAGGKAFTYACDLRNAERVRECAAKIIKEHPVDILINNAGIWTEDELEGPRPELREAALETNVLGHIELAEALLPHFKNRKAGHILNVISVAGASDSPSGDNASWRTYGATKWAMRGYTNALLSFLKETPVKVTGFYPGGFDSDIFETAGNADPHGQPWMMKTEDVADAAIFALTRPADVMVETMVVTKK